LLPDGPIPLRRETIACDPEDGTEGEPETLEVDEQLDTEGLGVPALLGLAQADFGALGWLCWSTGLDRIAMPGAIAPRAGIGAAIHMMVNRHWRASDRLATGGLLAMKHAVPGFSFQGVDIDLLPLNLIPGVVSELLAARSMFLWLVSPGTLSPFQDDIRAA
jgi:hypothetical protein